MNISIYMNKFTDMEIGNVNTPLSFHDYVLVKGPTRKIKPYSLYLSRGNFPLLNASANSKHPQLSSSSSSSSSYHHHDHGHHHHHPFTQIVDIDQIDPRGL